mmetsp:Transcript_31637/g.102793  ORF Transcript_31637/g.102793 Transcript_31637/m.102793 type:complete len:217 (+) Transcript_31637:204-854(+)
MSPSSMDAAAMGVRDLLPSSWAWAAWSSVSSAATRAWLSASSLLRSATLSSSPPSRPRCMRPWALKLRRFSMTWTSALSLCASALMGWRCSWSCCIFTERRRSSATKARTTTRIAARPAGPMSWTVFFLLFDVDVRSMAWTSMAMMGYLSTKSAMACRAAATSDAFAVLFVSAANSACASPSAAKARTSAATAATSKSQSTFTACVIVSSSQYVSM